MNNLDRVRDLFPLAAALILLASLSQARGIQRYSYPTPGFSVEAAMAKVKWHMLEVARNERDEVFLYPGN